MVPGHTIFLMELAIYLMLMLVVDNLAKGKKTRTLFLDIPVNHVGQQKMIVQISVH